MGQNIRRYRKSRGFTQKQLAELSGVGHSHIGKIETGKAVPSLETVVSIANTLEIGLDRIINGSIMNKEDSFIMEILSMTKELDDEDKICALHLVLSVLSALNEYKK